MSGYEALASTQMLAVNCAVCARPLLDATSIERGIGPDCARKYGFDTRVDQVARAEANQLVHLIAVAQRGPTVPDACARLRELGFPALAARILERFADVRLERVGDLLRLHNKYDPAVTERFRQVPGRRFNGEEKANDFPYSSRNALWAALRELYPGKKMLGPDGKLIAIQGKPLEPGPPCCAAYAAGGNHEPSCGLRY
jgi:hypothetical protein